GLAEDLAEPVAAVFLDTLGAGKQHCVGRKSGIGELPSDRPGGGGGNHEDDERMRQRVRQVAGGMDAFLELDSFQVAGIAVAGIDGGRDFRVPSYELDEAELAAEQFGDGGAEGPGPEDRGGCKWGI